MVTTISEICMSVYLCNNLVDFEKLLADQQETQHARVCVLKCITEKIVDNKSHSQDEKREIIIKETPNEFHSKDDRFFDKLVCLSYLNESCVC